MDKATLRLVSDGTPAGTRILVEPGGQELDVKSFLLGTDPMNGPQVHLLTVTVHVFDPLPEIERLREEATRERLRVQETVERNRRSGAPDA